MKKLLVLPFALLLLNACAPTVGSQDWCDAIKEKPKGDVTANEMVDFTKYCIFKAAPEEE